MPHSTPFVPVGRAGQQSLCMLPAPPEKVIRRASRHVTRKCPNATELPRSSRWAAPMHVLLHVLAHAAEPPMPEQAACTCRTLQMHGGKCIMTPCDLGLTSAEGRHPWNYWRSPLLWRLRLARPS